MGGSLRKERVPHWDRPSRGSSPAAPRYPYPARLEVDGRPARGRDISRSGLSAYIDEPLPVGQVVGVTLGWVPDGAPALSAPARVVRCVREGEGHLVGLEFVRGAGDRILSPEPPPPDDPS